MKIIRGRGNGGGGGGEGSTAEGIKDKMKDQYVLLFFQHSSSNPLLLYVSIFQIPFSPDPYSHHSNLLSVLSHMPFL